MKRIFCSVRQKISKHLIHGIDIETYEKNMKILMTSIYNANGYNQIFIRQNKFMYTIKHSRSFRGAIWSATNLSFDFFGLFHNHKEKGQFMTLFRGSSLIFAKTRIVDNEFKYNIYSKNIRMTKFLDTMNFSPISVKKAGELLKLPKLDMKEIIGQKPNDAVEWYSMILYNIRDSEISSKFMIFLKESFEYLGATFKDTIASTAMSLFRNKYLGKRRYYRHDEDLLIEIFKSYYGGRCEVLKRGITGKMYYYDINCFSDDTEILTIDGFKMYNEIKKDDFVYSMKGDNFIINKVNDIVIRDYDGIMINLVNENTDQLVTPNHRIYYKDYNRTLWHKDNGYYGWCREWKIKNAVDIPNSYIKFPNAKIYDGHITPDDDRLKLAAWFITEGHLNYNIFELSQSWDHNPEKCLMILLILNRLKIRYRRKDRIQQNKKYLYVYIDYSEIYEIMGNRYDNSYEMRLPDNFIYYSLKSKRILFEELMKGDGSYQNGKTSYVSFSDRLLDDFQILCTLIGIKCSVNRKYHTCYIKINRSGDSSLQKKSVVDYKGKVWCVSVNEKNVVVRRKGKIFISGNSLYPSVMHDNVFPDPNSVHFTFKNSLDKIKKYEGCSLVTVYCPNMRYPLLPVRHDIDRGKKVLFPIGKFEGWYTHIELRKAIKLGYKILSVKKSIYYLKTCEPFKDYVTDLYNLRKQYQKENNPMENVCKLLLNSVYGKFGERFLDRENTIPMDLVDEDFLRHNDILEVIGDYVRYKQSRSDPAAHCIPIWASYVTAYGRIKLYDAIVKYDSVYHDTDAILTEKKLRTSKELGKFKLEMKINQAILVKPKFYALYGTKDGEQVEEVKIKGFSRAITQLKIAGHIINLDGRKKKNMNFTEFKRFLLDPKAEYDKFVKFKEALRRHLIPNQVILMEKWFNIEDNKREWSEKFSLDEIQDSKPVIMTMI